MELTAPCFFLDRLPAELRNGIYELAFETRRKDGNPTNLRRPKPPSKALLLSCRQVHQEARGLYLEAYKRYWEEGPFEFAFTYSLRKKMLRKRHLDRLGGNLEHIKDMRVRIHLSPVCTVRWTLADARGIWKFERLWTPEEAPNRSSVTEYIALYKADWDTSPATISTHTSDTMEEAVDFCNSRSTHQNLYSQLRIVFGGSEEDQRKEGWI